METQQLTAARERAAKLERQIGELQAKQRVTEGKLDAEHQLIRRSAAERGSLVESLTVLEGDAARHVHHRVDGLDAAIRVSERMAEGLQKSLARSVQEIEALRNELAEVQRSIAAEENAAALAAWKAQMEQRFRAARESLANARTDLAMLNQVAAKGAERFGGPAAGFLAPAFEQFQIEQANPEQNGWLNARPIYQPLNINVRPMVR